MKLTDEEKQKGKRKLLITSAKIQELMLLIDFKDIQALYEGLFHLRKDRVQKRNEHTLRVVLAIVEGAVFTQRGSKIIAAAGVIYAADPALN